MTTPKELWKPIINFFQPVGPTSYQDVIIFFVDRHEDEPMRSMVKMLEIKFRNRLDDPKPYKALLTGYVGSGKSSELIRLGQALADDYFVVHFDAENTLSPETTNQFDILLAMGLAIHKAADNAGYEPPKALINELLKSMTKLVRKYESHKGFSLSLDQLLKMVSASAIGAVVSGGVGAVVGAVIGAARLELNVKDEHVRSLEIPVNREAVITALDKLIAWVQQTTHKPVMLIIDGLDKVTATRAKLLFADSSLLRDPGCALVYAAPIEFYHRVTSWNAQNIFEEYKLLPNPPVHRRPYPGDHWNDEREAEENGLKVMRRVVTRRLECLNHQTDDIITPEALTLLARHSGGVMRELIRYFRDAATFAQLLGQGQIDLPIAEEVISQQQRELASRLNINHRETLKRILQQGNLSGGQFEAIEDELLRSLFLLSYQDQHTPNWYDAHPNVLKLL